jgi:DNA-directed RNA polymerase delta subunit
MDLKESTKNLLEAIDKRPRKVIKRRFGLFDYQKATLARIGADMDLTRERVRQIESAGLKALTKNNNLATINKELKRVEKAVAKLGGIVVISQAANIVIGSSKRDKDNLHCLELILTLIPDLKISKQNQEFSKYWYDKNYDNKVIKKIAKEYRKILSNIGKPVKIDRFLNEFKKTTLGKKVKLSKVALEQIIHLDKKIAKNNSGQVGLMSWSSINPKSAREKAYIVLERAGKPLHYRKIAKQIKETNFYSDHNPTAATVHNEVILDDRFVLIGRGIYGLKKWGYRPGTVEDVIVSILKKHPKGLDRSKIVDKVLDQRKVAKNTILANLNRKSEFIKKEDQIYALK